jgi:hypothetical protein
MATRVTADGVKAIISGTTLTDAAIEIFITAANLIINGVYADATTTPSEDVLTEMERFYAAHMIASTNYRLPAREKVGDAEVEYGNKVEYVGEGYDRLAATPYGQQVLALDSTGQINKVGKRAAKIFAIPSFE